MQSIPLDIEWEKYIKQPKMYMDTISSSWMQCTIKVYFKNKYCLKSAAFYLKWHLWLSPIISCLLLNLSQWNLQGWISCLQASPTFVCHNYHSLVLLPGNLSFSSHLLACISSLNILFCNYVKFTKEHIACKVSKLYMSVWFK